MNSNVIVVGAGIGGLASSLYLEKLGYHVRILEQADSIGPVGAGLLLPPAGQVVLDELGLLAEVAAGSAVINRVRAEKASGEPLLDLRYCDLNPELRALGTPRQVLFESLRKKAEQRGIEILPAHRVGALESLGECAQVTCETGERMRGAFVVVADGSRSIAGDALELRRWCLTYSCEALWTVGNLHDPTQDFLLQRLDGVRRLAGLLPLGGGRASFFWGVDRDEHITDREAFRAEAHALIPEAAPIIDQLAADGRCARASYRTTIHFPWYRGRIVLLGDAAHAMSPHLGQGASLALVDAARLARAIDRTGGDPSRAFQEYQGDRFCKTLYYVLTSIVTSPFFQSHVTPFGPLRNFLLPLLQRFPWIEKQMVATMSGLKGRLFETQMTMDELIASTRSAHSDST